MKNSPFNRDYTFPLKVSDFRALAVKIKEAIEEKCFIETHDRPDEPSGDSEILDAIVKGINDFYE